MKITVFGAGFVGLTTAACFAEIGHKVLCVDIDSSKIEGLTAGRVPFHEPDLEPLVKDGLRYGNLSFTTDTVMAANHGPVCFITVGTPPREDGTADKSMIFNVADTLGNHLEKSVLIVQKSTVPGGSTEEILQRVRELVARRQLQIDIDAASNPEFLQEGSVVSDFTKPSRIVIGAATSKARETLRSIYRPYESEGAQLIFTDIRSAELTKYAANVMLASRISLMNELALLADHLGANIDDIRHGLGSDPRIGEAFLKAGIGYGGSCLPKDVNAFNSMQRSFGIPPHLGEAIEKVNRNQPSALIDKIEAYFGHRLQGRRLAVWGLSFKGGTSDIRASVAIDIVERLLAAGCRIRAYDPAAMEDARQHFGACANLEYGEDMLSTLEDVEALVICNDWSLFLNPNWEGMRQHLAGRAIFDGRNLYALDEIRALGNIDYYSIGRPPVLKKSVLSAKIA